MANAAQNISLLGYFMKKKRYFITYLFFYKLENNNIVNAWNIIHFVMILDEPEYLEMS
jgi:hypothetical protein